MKSDSKLSSRDAQRRGLSLAGATVSLPVLLVGCGSKEEGGGGGGSLTCTDETGLSDAEKSMRTTLQYSDVSADPSKTCDGCALYTQGPAGKCGGCTLLKGPIHPKGTCTSWAKKA